jgi:hypothetical protein
LVFIFLGIELTTELIIEIVLINGFLVALGVFGFKNIRKYIADIRAQLKRIREKRKEL